VRVAVCVEVRLWVRVRVIVCDALDVLVDVLVSEDDDEEDPELVAVSDDVLVAEDVVVPVRELVRDRLAIRVAVAEGVRVAVDD
jgi:hypothetical protein